MGSLGVKARYAGMCAACGGYFPEGAEIAKTQDHKWKHVPECPPEYTRSVPKPRTGPRSFDPPLEYEEDKDGNITAIRRATV